MLPITREELLTLAAIRARPCVSLYLPLHRTAPESGQDAIRLRNLVRDAELTLQQLGFTQKEATAFLGPILEQAQNPAFWRDPADGLAVFAWADGIRVFKEPVRFPEIVKVSGRFHLKPLLACLAEDGRFWTLAFSQGATRLFRGSRIGLTEVEIPGLPQSREDTLRERGHTPQEPDMMSATRKGISLPIHGFPGRRENIEQRYIVEHARAVEKALQPILRADGAPLVLYGAEPIVPMYRDVNTYPGLVAAKVNGNADRLNATEIHRKAWPVVEPVLKERVEHARALFLDLLATSRTSDHLETVLQAAHQGRVLHLFVPLEGHEWGTFDPETGRIRTEGEPSPDNEDLLDLAAVRTLEGSGFVHVVQPGDMPANRGIAAVFRY